MFREKRIILSIIFSIIVGFSYAQWHIGIQGGLGKSSFFDLENDPDYNAEFSFQNCSGISLFHESKNDSTSNLKVEIEYTFINAKMIVSHDAGYSSFYSDIAYSMQQIRLNCIYTFSLMKLKKMNLSYSIGPTIAYSFNSVASGSGWHYIYGTQTDSLGNIFPVITLEHWVVNGIKSDDISPFNLGLCFGLNLIIPVNKKVDFIVNNKYNVFFTNIINTEKTKYTSLFSGQLNMGVRFNFDLRR